MKKKQEPRQDVEIAWAPSPEFFQDVMNSLIAGCLIVHSDGRVLYVSEALAPRLQGSTQLLAGRLLIEVWPGVEKTQMFSALLQCLQDRRPARINAPLIFPDGRQDRFLLSFTPVPDGVCILFDETGECERIEEVLRDCKDRFETVAEQITDTLSVIDLDGNILFANHYAAKNLGAGLPEDVVGKNIGDFVTSPVKALELIARYRIISATQRPFSEEVQITLQDRTFWFFNRLIPFEYGTEKIPSVLSTSLDITERKQVEEALRKNQRMLARTEKIANVGSWEWDIAPDHVRWSDELFRLFGRDSAAGAPSFAEHANLYVPEDMQCLQQAVQRCVADGTPYELELRAIRPDGTIRHCVARGKAERDQDGLIRHLAGSLQDVTDHKQAEERLRDNYDLLNITQQLTKVGGWEWDIVNQKMSWTDETFRIHGLTPEDFEAGSSEPIQRSIACYDPEFSPVIEAAFQHCVEAGEPYELECLITAVGGQHKWISTTGQPVIKDGKIVKVIGNIADITERKRAENVMRTHEHYLDTILQTAGDGFLVVDPKGKVIDVNDAYCRMSGYTRDEILGMSVAELDPDEGSDGFDARVKDIISKGSAFFERRHHRKDGSFFPVEISVTWLKENGGQLISFCRDLTERKRAEDERQRLQEQLFQSQKMESVGRLAGGVAHDFNNMLGAILGHAELAMMKLGEDNFIRDDLKEIVFAASRSADITRQLLAFARKQIVLPKVLDLNQRVEEMLKMIRRLIGEDIDLLWLPGRNLWPLKMDPSQINQILVNLCVNARDAIAGAGKITIETGMVTFDAGYCAQHAEFVPGDFLLLAVSDNGRGMDRKTLNKLFEPFFTTKELGKGTGLGLATVYGIVKQNQGVINVYSEPGRGTTFNIYLPSHMEPMVDAKSEQKTDLERGCETILLVEDELVILKMTTMMLESLGYTVLATDNPSQACALARAHVGRIHLLITDVIMPLMNGRELAQQVLSLCPDIKCLFMSGYTANVIARHGVLKDGVQFLAKPFSMNDIAIKVRQVLDEKLNDTLADRLGSETKE